MEIPFHDILLSRKAADEPCEVCGVPTNDGYDIMYKTPKKKWAACRCKKCRTLLTSIPHGIASITIESKVNPEDAVEMIQHIDPWPL